jgi:hypothetical protein
MDEACLPRAAIRPRYRNPRALSTGDQLARAGPIYINARAPRYDREERHAMDMCVAYGTTGLPHALLVVLISFCPFALLP